MKTLITHYFNKIRGSFFFIPIVIILLGILLAVAFIQFDTKFNFSESRFGSFLFAGGAESARLVLSTIAASMIAVTGTVFSITIVALTLASSQFGPRMLRNFMQSRTNKSVLGIFLATFAYCLILIRTVKSEVELEFIPNLSVTFAILLALIDIIILIYFIHHISKSIQADNLIEVIYEELKRDLDRIYPEDYGTALKNSDLTLASDSQIQKIFDQIENEGFPIFAKKEGYIQAVNGEKLIKLAQEEDFRMKIIIRPGQYVNCGQLLAKSSKGSKENELGDEVLKSFIIGYKKTSEQDPAYALRQLTEIAVRALSPGINDPNTAQTCIDKIGSALLKLSNRDLETGVRVCDEGKIRLVMSTLSYRDFVDTAFNQVRQNSTQTSAVLTSMMDTFVRLNQLTNIIEHKIVLKDHARLVLAQAEESLSIKSDHDKLRQLYDECFDS